MSDFDRIKQTQFKFNQKAHTIDITGLPVDFFDQMLVSASLYNSLSVREYKVEKQVDPQYSTKENLQWCEGRGRLIRCLSAMFKTALGHKQETYMIEEADDVALATWVEQYADAPSRERPLNPPPGEPYIHVYRARMLMLQLMLLISYASQTINGLCRRNHYNRPEFVIAKMKLMPKLVKEITAHMTKFEAAYKPIEAEKEDIQDIERSFGTI